MPWFAAVPAAAGGLAATAGSAAAAAAPAIASAAGSLGSALGSVGSAIGSGLGSAASGLGSAAGSVGSALSEVPGALSSFGSGVGSALESGGGAIMDALPSFGSGGEAGILEGLGQTVPQGVELVGPQTSLGADAGIMFPEALNSGSSALPASFGGPQGATSPMDTGMLSQMMSGLGSGGGGDNALLDSFSPMGMLSSVMDPVGGFMKQPPPGPPLQMPERKPIQTADFGMNDRLASLVRAYQIQG